MGSMSRPVLVLCASLLLLTAAGCGSSSGGWDVVSQVSTKGKTEGFIDNAAVGRPSELEVKIDSTPNVAVNTEYTFLCGQVVSEATPTRYGPRTSTPFTLTLIIPPGPPTNCRVNVLATKAAAADLTMTLLMRSVPTG